jgi:hypothetical protein
VCLTIVRINEDFIPHLQQTAGISNEDGVMCALYIKYYRETTDLFLNLKVIFNVLKLNDSL